MSLPGASPALARLLAFSVHPAPAAALLAFFTRSAAFGVFATTVSLFLAFYIIEGTTYIEIMQDGNLPAGRLAPVGIASPLVGALVGALLGHGLSVVLDAHRVLVDVRVPTTARTRVLARVPYTLLIVVGVGALYASIGYAVAVAALDGVLLAVGIGGALAFVVAGVLGLACVWRDLSSLMYALASLVLIALGVLVFNALLTQVALTPLAAAAVTCVALAPAYALAGLLFIVGHDALHLADTRTRSAFAWLSLYVLVASLYLVGGGALTAPSLPYDADAANADVAAALFIAFWAWTLVLLAVALVREYVPWRAWALAATYATPPPPGALGTYASLPVSVAAARAAALARAKRAE